MLKAKLRTGSITTSGPTNSKTYYFDANTPDDVYDMVASDLGLKAEKPSQGTTVQSWANEGETILLERGYGISFAPDELTKVQISLPKFGFDLGL